MPGNGKQPATRELNWTDARTHARTNNEPSKKRKDKSDEGEVNEDTDTAFKQAAHASLQSSNKRLAASSSKCPPPECEESDGDPYQEYEVRAPSQSCHSGEWSNPEESQEEEEMLIIDDDISGKVEMVAGVVGTAAVAAAEEDETVTDAVGTAAVAAAATKELPFKTTVQTLADTDRFFDEAFAVDACAKGAKQSTPFPST